MRHGLKDIVKMSKIGREAGLARQLWLKCLGKSMGHLSCSITSFRKKWHIPMGGGRWALILILEIETVWSDTQTYIYSLKHLKESPEKHLWLQGVKLSKETNSTLWKATVKSQCLPTLARSAVPKTELRKSNCRLGKENISSTDLRTLI